MLVHILISNYSMTFFFFNPKAAYDVRISYWSSDVCSSDLRRRYAIPQQHDRARQRRLCRRPDAAIAGFAHAAVVGGPVFRRGKRHLRRRHQRHPVHRGESARRSEEHTSELQSLMRISYAVFCLTKNNTTTSSDEVTRTIPTNTNNTTPHP